MSRWEQTKAKEKSITDHHAFVERVPEGRRKRLKKRSKVSDTEKLSIAHAVLVEKEFETEVAKAFRLSNARINAIVKQATQNKRIFKELRETHYENLNRKAIIKQ